MISQDIIKKGIVKTSETSIDEIKEINAYNVHACKCRCILKRRDDAKSKFKIVNPWLIAPRLSFMVYKTINYNIIDPLSLAVTGHAMSEYIQNNEALTFAIIFLNIITYIIAIKTDRYYLHVICSALLALIDSIMWILFIANIVFARAIYSNERLIASERGYPDFNVICIIHDEDIM